MLNIYIYIYIRFLLRLNRTEIFKRAIWIDAIYQKIKYRHIKFRISSYCGNIKNFLRKLHYNSMFETHMRFEIGLTRESSITDITNEIFWYTAFILQMLVQMPVMFILTTTVIWAVKIRAGIVSFFSFCVVWTSNLWIKIVWKSYRYDEKSSYAKKMYR